MLKFLKKVLSHPPKKTRTNLQQTQKLNHDTNAVSIIKTLQKHNHTAYFVGGCIRDSLINITPKDIDLVTSAKPEEIKKIIKNSRIIGKRFKLVHIYISRIIYELATFRGYSKNQKHSNPKIHSQAQSGRILRDNIYGNIEEDAQRRDFTVNALYYNPSTNIILDYHNGLKDIKKKIIRFIGDPETRITEDPVRMLRAIRISNKLNFSIDKKIEKLLIPLSNHLADIPPARLLEEYQKIFLSGQSLKNFTDIRKYKLMKYLFPLIEKHLDKNHNLINLYHKACKNTDKRINNNLGINPAFLIAIFLWPEYKSQLKKDIQNNSFLTIDEAQYNSCNTTLKKQRETITLTQRISAHIKEIWVLQASLEKCNPKLTNIISSNHRFRAAYDFLMLRKELDNIPDKTIDFWKPFEIQSQKNYAKYKNKFNNNLNNKYKNKNYNKKNKPKQNTSS
jgi:poly(A) polymerase